VGRQTGSRLQVIPVPRPRSALQQSAGCHSSLLRCPRVVCRQVVEARRPPGSAASVAPHVEEFPRQSSWDCAAPLCVGLDLMSVRMRTLCPPFAALIGPVAWSEATRRTGIQAPAACGRGAIERRASSRGPDCVFERGSPSRANACVRAARGYERVSSDAERTRYLLCRREVVMTTRWSFEIESSIRGDAAFGRWPDDVPGAPDQSCWRALAVALGRRRRRVTAVSEPGWFHSKAALRYISRSDGWW
jgi:hypothetical protein